MSSSSLPMRGARDDDPLQAPTGTVLQAEQPLLIGDGSLSDPADDPSPELDLFSVRRPKHAIAGLSSGLKNVGKVRMNC